MRCFSLYNNLMKKSTIPNSGPSIAIRMSFASQLSYKTHYSQRN